MKLNKNHVTVFPFIVIQDLNIYHIDNGMPERDDARNLNSKINHVTYILDSALESTVRFENMVLPSSVKEQEKLIIKDIF